MTIQRELARMHELRAENLSKIFRQEKNNIIVLSAINHSFVQGSSYAITGVSGSGKSTFLNILGGLETPSSGEVFFDQQSILSLRDTQKEKFLNASIGFVFQFHYLIKELTVLENVMMKSLIAGTKKTLARQEATTLLTYIGLEHKLQSYPTELSGGEQQRVSIARALINRPTFLLADEPTGNLDAENAQRIITLFLSLQKEYKTGIIICTHDEAVYSKMDHVLRLHEGNLTLC